MTRHILALILAAGVHLAAFWGWRAFRAAHSEKHALPTLDLSSVELSFSDAAESEDVQTIESPPTPPAEPHPTRAPTPTKLPHLPPAEPQQTVSFAPETPPDAMLTPHGLPLPVAAPPPPPSQPSAAPSPVPARETAHIQTPPAQPSSFRPRYPSGCRKRGEQGTVALEIEVDEQGRATRVRVFASSGFPDLDAAAAAAAAKARFTPATENGKPVPGRLRLPVEFKLQ